MTRLNFTQAMMVVSTGGDLCGLVDVLMSFDKATAEVHMDLNEGPSPGDYIPIPPRPEGVYDKKEFVAYLSAVCKWAHETLEKLP